jgi:hypothetical protein
MSIFGLNLDDLLDVSPRRWRRGSIATRAAWGSEQQEDPSRPRGPGGGQALRRSPPAPVATSGEHRGYGGARNACELPGPTRSGVRVDPGTASVAVREPRVCHTGFDLRVAASTIAQQPKPSGHPGFCGRGVCRRNTGHSVRPAADGRPPAVPVAGRSYHSQRRTRRV